MLKNINKRLLREGEREREREFFFLKDLIKTSKVRTDIITHTNRLQIICHVVIFNTRDNRSLSIVLSLAIVNLDDLNTVSVLTVMKVLRNGWRNNGDTRIVNRVASCEFTLRPRNVNGNNISSKIDAYSMG